MKTKKTCIVCQKLTNNKKYCSTHCQYEGYKVEKAEKVIVKCYKCNIEFKTTKNKLENGKGKFCSRECKDSYQKTKYVGEGNPMYGKKTSLKQKMIVSELYVERWKDKSFREYFKLKAEEFYKKNGYHYGEDKESCEKRKQSYIKKYGVSHNWKSPEVRKKCEETNIKLYGDTSLNLARKKLLLQGTRIEKIIENILINNNIRFKKQFRLYINDLEYRTYDFYIMEKKILIEADGDFWHANPQIYNKDNLHEIQKINLKNDELKNELASKLNYKLIRFWENEIKNTNFETILLKKINE